MSDIPETLILRFRDLVTPAGHTLQKHSELCAQNGFVWWGWWNKSGEMVPPIISSLKTAAKNTNGLEILLFDSGNQRIYIAKCVDIEWDKEYLQTASPEPTKTPEYYKDQKYCLWFKFSEIQTTATDSSVLHNYSYVEVNEFFTTKKSNYKRFYGKRVSTCEELRQQDRSIWFVRKSKPADPTHEILLLDSKTLAPQHFPTEFKQTDSRNLLWLSDIHCGSTHPAFPLAASEAEKTLPLALEQAFRAHGIRDLGGVIVSGDLTWKADAEEYSQMLGIFKGIQSWAKLQPYDFCVVPGNHDIAFSEHPENKESAVTRALPEARKNYSALYKSMFYIEPNEHICCGRRFLLGNGIPVELALLNSSFLSQESHVFQGHGFVGQSQLAHVAQEMKWNETADGAKPFRIAVLHHHLLPVTFQEVPESGRIYSVALDAEMISRWAIKYGVDLILHGHMHQPYFARVERPESFGKNKNSSFYVAGLGATGYSRLDGLEKKENTYSILEFTDNGCVLKYFTVDKTNPSVKIVEYVIPKKK